MSSLRARLMWAIIASVLLAVALVGGLTQHYSRSALDQADEERAAVWLAQFEREFERRGKIVEQRTDAVVNSEMMLRMALDLTGPAPDSAPFVNEAQSKAAQTQLDLLQLVAPDGTILSSAHWPARFGFKEPWLRERSDWNQQPPFLKVEELADSKTLAMVSVRSLKVREADFYAVGGAVVDEAFLRSLPLPAGTRVMLLSADGRAIASSGPVNADTLLRVTESARGTLIKDGSGGSEIFYAMPLRGRQSETLGHLIFASSRAAHERLSSNIQKATLAVGLFAVLLAVILSIWIAGRITSPVEELVEASERVAAGDWDARVPVTGNDEIAALAGSFNRMTEQLISQRSRLVQSERVAAWRELARRLAHELKNPLFPLQLTVENLLRARQSSSAEFEEVFKESTSTLLVEIAHLKDIIARFNDFSRMPAPQSQPTDLNMIINNVVQLFAARFERAGKRIQIGLKLEDALPLAEVDPVLMRRVIENLVLNALDAMPQGGALSVTTSAERNHILISIADSGEGLTPEECARLFTPYYTTKQHGTGLGLAIVQSIISDHNGSIRVDSEKQRGTTFTITLPQQATGKADRVVTQS